jgi:hypothetical protein
MQITTESTMPDNIVNLQLDTAALGPLVAALDYMRQARDRHAQVALAEYTEPSLFPDPFEPLVMESAVRELELLVAALKFANAQQMRTARKAAARAS